MPAAGGIGGGVIGRQIPLGGADWVVAGRTEFAFRADSADPELVQPANRISVANPRRSERTTMGDPTAHVRRGCGMVPRGFAV